MWPWLLRMALVTSRVVWDQWSLRGRVSGCAMTSRRIPQGTQRLSYNSPRGISRFGIPHTDTHAQTPIIVVRFLPELEYVDRFLVNFTNTKFYENPFSGSRIVTWRQTDRQTDMAKLIGAFLQPFAVNALKNGKNGCGVSSDSISLHGHRVDCPERGEFVLQIVLNAICVGKREPQTRSQSLTALQG
jgi:hypothetical protein